MTNEQLQKFRNPKGSILLVTILVMTVILTVAMGAAGLVASGIVMNRTQSQSTQAFFAAETGIERVLWEIRRPTGQWFDLGDCSVGQYVDFDQNPNDCTSDVADATEPVGGKEYYVKYTSSTPQHIFSSVGKYFGTVRTIEIRF